MHKNGETINDFAVSRAIELVREGKGDAMVDAMKDTIAIAHNGTPIKCRTIGQRAYVDAMRKNARDHLHRTCGYGRDLYWRLPLWLVCSSARKSSAL